MSHCSVLHACDARSLHAKKKIFNWNGYSEKLSSVLPAAWFMMNIWKLAMLLRSSFIPRWYTLYRHSQFTRSLNALRRSIKTETKIINETRLFSFLWKRNYLERKVLISVVLTMTKKRTSIRRIIKNNRTFTFELNFLAFYWRNTSWNLNRHKGASVFGSDIAHVSTWISRRRHGPYVRVHRHVRAVKKLPYSDHRSAVTCKPSGRHCCILLPSLSPTPSSSISSNSRDS